MNQPTVNIDELEKLALAATPGPWKYRPTLQRWGAVDPVPLLETRRKDARYIAAANPTTILALIKLVRENVTQAIVDSVWHPDAVEVPGTEMVAIPMATAEKLEALADLADRRKFADQGYAMPNVGLTWGECRRVRDSMQQATFVVSASIG
jgi:hypothetical protein